MFDKILELLGVDKLDEEKQEKIKKNLSDLFELTVKESLNEKLEYEKKGLVEEFEGKFETYKNEITEKFSNFLDKVLDEELIIPDEILEFARKGELYNELIEQFKIRLAIDEGVIDDEVKNLLKEARNEIVSNKKELDENISKVLNLELERNNLKAELHLREKCDGLTEVQKINVLKMLEGVNDIEEIDRKFDIIVESSDKKIDEINEVKKNEEEDDKDDKDDKDADDKDDKDADDKKKKKKKDDEDEDDEDDINEDSPFKEVIEKWAKTVRDNKI